MRRPKEWAPVSLLAMALLTGCGASAANAMHSALDRATDVIDPAYGLAVSACDASEGEAIARAETREEAEDAVAAIRRECNVIFASFEDLRALQDALRATAEAVADGQLDKRDLLRSVDELQEGYERTRALVRAFGARRDR